MRTHEPPRKRRAVSAILAMTLPWFAADGLRATSISRSAPTGAVAYELGGDLGSTPTVATRASGAQLVFQRSSDIWLTTVDGTKTRRLVANGGQPAVSPNGRRVAFVRSESIWLMARNGSGQRKLTSGHRDVAPDWAPDGRAIYFSRYLERRDASGDFVGYAYAIFRMRSDGSGVTQVTRPPPSDHGTCHDSPSVAPNGSVIAYALFGDCDHGVPDGIEAVDPSGRRVSLGAFGLPGEAFSPDWSPDGRRLAIAWGLWDDPGLGVAGNRTRAAKIYDNASDSPVWSRDGKWIAFTRGGSRGSIWLIRPNGTGLRRITSRRTDGHPAWLPVRVR